MSHVSSTNKEDHIFVLIYIFEFIKQVVEKEIKFADAAVDSVHVQAKCIDKQQKCCIVLCKFYIEDLT